MLLLFAVQTAYGKFGHGVEFFPNVEPDYGQVIVHARGNLALDEKDKPVAEVEKRVLAFDGLKTVYARIGEQPRGMGELTEDTIGVIQFEFADWRARPPAHAIMDAIRDKTADIPGILVEVTAPRAGPPTGKPIQVQLCGARSRRADAGGQEGRGHAGATRRHPRSRRRPAVARHRLEDRGRQGEAAKYGAGVNAVGSAVQLVTNGLKATEYRPVDSDKSVDILVRFPPDRRSLDQIDDLRVQTQAGHVPIGNFVTPRPGAARRLHQPRQRQPRDDGVGERRRRRADRDGAGGHRARARPHRSRPRRDASSSRARTRSAPRRGAFLMKAFGTAIFLIFAILLAQFNRLTSVGLVLSAVVMSTFGVLLGLMIMGQPFGVVMTGIGVIANAGVIVNNNIVLIDTYDRLRREGVAAYDAILETCRERARPVVLTAVTAILGVLPIAFGVNVEFLSREITVGAPATQWWINLSTAIVFGLGFATVLTLVVTPAALMAIENMRLWRIRTVARVRGLFARRQAVGA